LIHLKNLPVLEFGQGKYLLLVFQWQFPARHRAILSMIFRVAGGRGGGYDTVEDG
jgi:hypothetical protein